MINQPTRGKRCDISTDSDTYIEGFAIDKYMW